MVAVRNVIGMLVAALSLSLGFMVAAAPHALAATGGYPYANATDCSATHGPDSWCIGGSDISPYGYGYRNCTDYVAWKIRQVLGVTLPKTLGNAATWGSRLSAAGYGFDSSPRVGDIAAWNTADHGLGHVAYVYAVSGGIASLDEYNVADTGEFSSNRTTASGSAGAPDEYVHIGTLPGRAARLQTVGVGSTNGRTQVFAIGTSGGDMYVKTQAAAGSTSWSGWQDLGGTWAA